MLYWAPYKIKGYSQGLEFHCKTEVPSGSLIYFLLQPPIAAAPVLFQNNSAWFIFVDCIYFVLNLDTFEVKCDLNISVGAGILLKAEREV